ncbi:hypothetical protein D5085_09570 [Ectothiorhodospiraceae bacterium BW-2]|nr:hypothetical protein D5085_09570 [Ectothiorhodospiraceae bacterium BW-2]
MRAAIKHSTPQRLFIATIAMVPHTLQADSDPLAYALGEALFERIWVSAPASTQAADGLGPLYNSRACSQCHPAGGDLANGLVVQLDTDPIYGAQLQTQAIATHLAEGQLKREFQPNPVTLADGTTLSLQQPHYQLESLGYGPLAAPQRYSVRIAPPLWTIGAIARIDPSAVAAQADATDQNGDGISGRLQQLGGELGRFGWRATEPTLEAQIERALRDDMGLSTRRYPKGFADCTAAQSACRAAPDGNSLQYEGVEVQPLMVNAIADYLQRLTPPRTTTQPATSEIVTQGEQLFAQSGCHHCHTPQLPDRHGRAVTLYSDLLLHDMGQALADNLPQQQASGHEWRTPPLIAVAHRSALLHDGRAKSLTEAILWHGGEATAAKQRFINLSASQRQQLLTLLEQL